MSLSLSEILYDLSAAGIRGDPNIIESKQKTGPPVRRQRIAVIMAGEFREDYGDSVMQIHPSAAQRWSARNWRTAAA
jgi:hypothetical protein